MTNLTQSAALTQQPTPVPLVAPTLPPRLAEQFQLAQVIVTAGWFSHSSGKGSPTSYEQDVAQTFVKLLWGRELGMGDMAAITGIDVIDGKPSPSGGLIAARLDEHPSYAFEVLVRDKQRCSLAFFVGDDLRLRSAWNPNKDRSAPPWEDMRPSVSYRGTTTFAIEDAKAAGLASKTNWKNYPRAMLFNRAVSEGQRAYAPSLWQGSKLYTPEEIGRDDLIESDPDLSSGDICAPFSARRAVPIEKVQNWRTHAAKEEPGLF